MNQSILNTSPQFPVNEQRPLPHETDVVIIGAGIIGMCTAWMLARDGVNCVVLEKGLVGAEQSTRNWGWIRMQGRSAAEVPMMKISQPLWQDLSEQSGHSIGYRQIGCTYIAENEKQLAQRVRFMDTAREYELSTVQLSARQVVQKFGQSLAPTVGAIHTPTDCCAEPVLAMPAIAKLAVQSGAQVFESCAVRTLDRSGGALRGVMTEHGMIRCNRVLLAAGAWSRTFLENDGISLPQLAVKSSAFRTAAVDLPFQSAVASHAVAIRPRMDGGVTVGKSSASSFQLVPAAFRHLRAFLPVLTDGRRSTAIRVGRDFFGPLGRSRWRPDQITPFENHRILNPTPDASMIRAMTKAAVKTFGSLQDLKIADQWAGMIDVTPDELPVIDRIADQEGVFIATGFSGHGFGLGPGAAFLARSLILGETPTLDKTAFAFKRFSG